ncbi:hypothetical protein A2634_01155 [Candidatus Amesbacteria bacterium RIFCSPHIGHO2_01_FULL_48_32]|uniref:Antitoxin VbhA domain-containing protein n=1 Tax=Candidatus Amesbacteria bacterium RIFCSPLOWO2_01_FULL_48_25 TaxID=1797259 RepID=A0A1F4ZBB0_9BACT|nr:MAG: hypothetical protein A2634_01155 [Candidatus Amesbacteria bacterium RIFCSPHIGHO2_01_FULL_48_32]OGD03649.1 MAG: hypothetical protein A2989_03140 [Candidatus Amesbacteria bacterium RIFCSPLOWO2_01_FULL_48_25]HJZ06004.1 hypothetical protein [Patescibacteria group bacterium]
MNTAHDLIMSELDRTNVARLAALEMVKVGAMTVEEWKRLDDALDGRAMGLGELGRGQILREWRESRGKEIV